MEFGGAMVKIPDTKINWRRRLGVQICKDRGNVGPQKLYINPFIAPISESRRHQKKFKSLFLDRKLDLKGVGQGTSVGSSVTWVIQSSSLSTIFDTAIRFALEPLFEDDLGNTRGKSAWRRKGKYVERCLRNALKAGARVGSTSSAASTGSGATCDEEIWSAERRIGV